MLVLAELLVSAAREDRAPWGCSSIRRASSWHGEGSGSKARQLHYTRERPLRLRVLSHMRLKKPRAACPSCQEEVTNLRSTFCSNSCQQEHQYRAYIARWKAGLESGHHEFGTTKNVATSGYLRRYLYGTFGEKCQKCGWAEKHPVTGKIPLTVDHVDGDFLNCKESNLLILCPNCHSLTPTYGILNKGNGRWAQFKARQG